MIGDILPWLLFLAFVLGMLALDLGVFQRRAHAVSRREALAWSGVWIGLAALFNAGVFIVRGTEDGVAWTAGYLIEKSLSVDNVFLFLLIFSAFAVPAAYQHRVLFWGVIGALAMRAALIIAGGALLTQFHAIIYIFGAVLVVSGLRFLRGEQQAPSLERNRVIRLVRRVLPATSEYDGQRFFTRRGGALAMTPLFLVLVLVENADLVFAVDSIPAIYGVTDDPFLVFSSNVFAVLGLRSMYFVLAGYLGGLRYLRPALAAVLLFVGAKMLLSGIVTISAPLSLAMIVAILTIAVTASLLRRPRPPVTPAVLPEPLH